MTIKAVIFDIGNVLIEWQPEAFYDRKIGIVRRKAFFDAVDMHRYHHTIDQGAPFRETVYAVADKYPDWRTEICMWHDNWVELAAPDIPHSVRILNALRRNGVTVFALTNFGADNYPLTQDVYPFLKGFDREYVSGCLKTAKPDPEIYAFVERDCGIAVDRLLFTDDRDDNITTAAARGWQTHHFTGPQGWADRLISEGLLSKEDAR